MRTEQNDALRVVGNRQPPHATDPEVHSHGCVTEVQGHAIKTSPKTWKFTNARSCEKGRKLVSVMAFLEA